MLQHFAALLLFCCAFGTARFTRVQWDRPASSPSVVAFTHIYARPATSLCCVFSLAFHMPAIPCLPGCVLFERFPYLPPSAVLPFSLLPWRTSPFSHHVVCLLLTAFKGFGLVAVFTPFAPNVRFILPVTVRGVCGHSLCVELWAVVLLYGLCGIPGHFALFMGLYLNRTTPSCIWISNMPLQWILKLVYTPYYFLLCLTLLCCVRHFA